MIDTEDYLMLSGIQHFCFCKRQWGLIHIEQLWADNTRTFGGTTMHEKADDPFCTETRGDIFISRSMPIVSNKLKLRGIADVIEFHKSDKGITLEGKKELWEIIPVEYKYGEPKENNSDMVQLVAQAICLEEMFCTDINHGYLYYGKIRRRVDVDFTEELRKEVKILAEEMYSYFSKGKTPDAIYAEYCKNCSMKELCTPKLFSKTKKIKKYLQEAIEY